MSVRCVLTAGCCARDAPRTTNAEGRSAWASSRRWHCWAGNIGHSDFAVLAMPCLSAICCAELQVRAVSRILFERINCETVVNVAHTRSHMEALQHTCSRCDSTHSGRATKRQSSGKCTLLRSQASAPRCTTNQTPTFASACKSGRSKTCAAAANNPSRHSQRHYILPSSPGEPHRTRFQITHLWGASCLRL